MLRTVLALTFVAIVFTSNLGVGFCAALILNRGPRTLREGYGANWRYRLGVLLRRRHSVPVDVADSDHVDSHVPAMDEAAVLETIDSLSDEIGAIEVTFAEFNKWLESVIETTPKADLEQQVESVESKSQVFLGKLNSLVASIVLPDEITTERDQQLEKVREACDALWQSVNENIAQAFRLPNEASVTDSAQTLKNILPKMDGAFISAKNELAVASSG